jgi:hypothetical protein
MRTLSLAALLATVAAFSPAPPPQTLTCSSSQPCGVTVNPFGIVPIPASTGSVGPVGPSGPAGPQGVPGVAGPSGPSGPAGAPPKNSFAVAPSTISSTKLVCPQGDGTVVPVMVVTAGTLSAATPSPATVTDPNGKPLPVYAFSIGGTTGVQWVQLTPTQSSPNTYVVSTPSN